MPDWYEKGGHAFILRAKKEPAVSIQDVFKRAVKIMEKMKEKKYYSNSVDFMLDDANFENLDDDGMLKIRDRISGWIGQPIDQRAMLGSAMNPLRIGKEPSKEIIVFNEANRLCWTMHDVLWIAWRGIGEYMGGDKLDWARGLKNKTIRRMIADCFKFVCDHDEYLLDNFKEGFTE
jgi:MoaA/NifB/PqqE/SkfB family radical SAM enzyme